MHKIILGNNVFLNENLLSFLIFIFEALIVTFFFLI